MKKLKKSHKKFKRSSKKHFDKFRNFFPFSCIDLILPYNGSILLTKRTIPPYKNKWHLPGGIIRKNETMTNAAIRIAKAELNLNIKISQFLGTYENLNQYRHDITHCFIGSIQNGEIIPDFQSSQIKLFKKMPKNIIPYHRKIIHDAKNSINR